MLVMKSWEMKIKNSIMGENDIKLNSRIIKSNIISKVVVKGLKNSIVPYFPCLPSAGK